MGRLPKKGVDYFPHDTAASSKPTLYIVQQKYGNDGYAFWFKLLEFIGMQDGLTIDFSVQKDWLYFLSMAKVSEDVGKDILGTLASIEAIDKELWFNQKVVWSQHFADRLASVYGKRGGAAPKRPQAAAPEPPPTESGGKNEEKKPPKKKKDSVKEEKKSYGDYVKMTEREYKSLVEKVGQIGADACIEKLNNYKGSSGKTYKSDYMAILNWVVDDIKKQKPGLIAEKKTVAEKAAETATGNPFDEYGE